MSSNVEKLRREARRMNVLDYPETALGWERRGCLDGEGRLTASGALLIAVARVPLSVALAAARVAAMVATEQEIGPLRAVLGGAAWPVLAGMLGNLRIGGLGEPSLFALLAVLGAVRMVERNPVVDAEHARAVLALGGAAWRVSGVPGSYESSVLAALACGCLDAEPIGPVPHAADCPLRLERAVIE